MFPALGTSVPEKTSDLAAAAPPALSGMLTALLAAVVPAPEKKRQFLTRGKEPVISTALVEKTPPALISASNRIAEQF